MEFEVRRASTSDIGQIVEFTRNTFPWGDYVPRVVGEWVRAGTAYVAVRGGEVLGVLNAVDMGNGVVWLEGLRVKPGWRRMGVGRGLTLHAINEARLKGARYAMLMIAEWNTPSQNLAKSLGFREALTLYTGVAEASRVRVVKGPEAVGYIEEALKASRGYFCTTRGHWACTRADVDYVLSKVDEVYVGGGIGLGTFSVGPPTTPIESEVLSTEPGQFKRYYGKYIIYELSI